MSDFDLDKSRWYNAMKIALAADAMIGNAEVIAKRAPILATFPYDAAAGQKLAEVEEKITAALDAVTVAREKYEKKRVALVAAE